MGVSFRCWWVLVPRVSNCQSPWWFHLQSSTIFIYHRLSKLITLSNKKKASPLSFRLFFSTSHITHFFIKTTKKNKSSVSTKSTWICFVCVFFERNKKKKFISTFVSSHFSTSLSSIDPPVPLPPSFHRFTNFVHTVASTVAKSRRNNGLEEKQIDKKKKKPRKIPDEFSKMNHPSV